MKLVYLASPYLYRGKVPKVDFNQEGWERNFRAGIQADRYEKAIDATAYLMSKGLAVYAPIVATHPVAVKHDMELGSEFWLDYDEILLRKCDEIVVLELDGWRESPGVQREIEIMLDLHKDVTYLHPETVEEWLQKK